MLRPRGLMSQPPPRSLAELAPWPATVLERLVRSGDAADTDRHVRLKSMAEAGMVVCSDYSGMSGETEILSQMATAMPKEFPSLVVFERSPATP